MAVAVAKLDFRNGALPLYEQIVQHLREAIARGDIGINDVLPSERELASAFQVSRVPVREAIKILEFLGGVERVPGKGLVVRAIDINVVLKSLDFLITDPLTLLKELFEMRECVETQAARLAAERRTDEDLRAMERALINMEVEIRMDATIEAPSVSFHAALVEATHNVILISVHSCLHNLLRYSRRQTLGDHRRYPDVLQFHRTIFEHVKAGEPEAAAQAMHAHLSNALNFLEGEHQKTLKTPLDNSSPLAV